MLVLDVDGVLTDGTITINEVDTDGYEFDPRGGQGIVDEVLLPDDDATGDMTEPYSYQIELPNKLVISGRIISEWWGKTTFHRKYRVHLRKPKPISGEQRADITDLLITRRGLQVCQKFDPPAEHDDDRRD